MNKLLIVFLSFIFLCLGNVTYAEKIVTCEDFELSLQGLKLKYELESDIKLSHYYYKLYQKYYDIYFKTCVLGEIDKPECITVYGTDSLVSLRNLLRNGHCIKLGERNE